MFASAGESMPVVRDVLLRDESTLRLHAPTPADFDDVRGFFDGLSADSRFMRFHGYARTDVAAQAAVEAGGPDRCSLIARHDGRLTGLRPSPTRCTCRPSARVWLAELLQAVRWPGRRLRSRVARGGWPSRS